MVLSHLDVLAHRMAYRSTGAGEPIVFLHGNPTSSLLWADVMNDLADSYRCIALDLMGMGASEKLPGVGDERYRLSEHARFLDAALHALGLDIADGGQPLVLVGHDWGAVLAIDCARRHPDRVRAIAYSEAGVVPLSWREGTGPDQPLFAALRGPEGEGMVLHDNLFIEVVLQAGTMRALSSTELAAHRRPFAEPGEDRRAMLTWARQIPIDGEPAEVFDLVSAGAAFMATSRLPKLLIRGEPGAIITGSVLRTCRTWPHQQEVSVSGTHFLPLDSPAPIAIALRAWLRELPGDGGE
jgi:haloalkane dehalogenase